MLNLLKAELDKVSVQIMERPLGSDSNNTSDVLEVLEKLNAIIGAALSVLKGLKP
jgi:hypothetical protein